MPGSLLAVALQIGPFWQQKPAEDYYALRPVAAREEKTLDVLWPLFTHHGDWWRFAFLAWWQDRPGDDSYQFTLLPVWYNGRDRDGRSYAGLFPIYGRHPHALMLYDAEFALWPLWHRYRMPRGRDWLETQSVLFPFVSWRSDGSWGVWPVYGVNHQRESDHRYALWPLATWASYREDRDTAGAGYSWMFFPLYGQVRREREKQDMFIPPFFSLAKTYSRTWAERGNSGPEIRLRCPWPFFEYESNARRSRLSVWPFYESVDWRSYSEGGETGSVVRFGWRLVEIYDDETRVFPFWARRSDGSYMRIWPLVETEKEKDVSRTRFLSLFPIRWVPAIDRNWAKFWTLYENESCPVCTDHSLFWGIVRWRTFK